MIMKIQKRDIEMINDIMIKWIIWTDNNIGESGARMISKSLKTNTTLTVLNLGCDEKWSKMKWIIIIIKKRKEWKNEIKIYVRCGMREDCGWVAVSHSRSKTYIFSLQYKW